MSRLRRWIDRLLLSPWRSIQPGDGAWTRWFGDRGEREAARFLRRNGIRTITRNFQTPQGEIDLIAREGDCLVFVEVKTRRQGEPALAVTPGKQRRIIRAAREFLHRHELPTTLACRYDVVAIVWPEAGRRPASIDHYRDAFRPDGPEPDRRSRR